MSDELCPVLDAAEADPAVRAIVFTGANGMFSGGADINDFGTWTTTETKTLRDVIARIEASTKTSVAVLERTALGGGFEVALACDYRIAKPGTRVGLPEIKLGLLPGAEGTQRLPRLIGANDALQFMLKGDPVAVEDGIKQGIVDEIASGDAIAAALAYTVKPKRRLSAGKAELGIPGMSLFALPYALASAHKLVPPVERGGFASHTLIDSVEAAV